jgi:hypothetical protein
MSMEVQAEIPAPEVVPPTTVSPAPARFSPQDHYQNYAQNPSQENLNKVMTSLKPVINQSLVSLGESSNPLLEERARIYAVQAIKKYSPDYGASLHTWVRGQLMQLNRARRELNSPIKVPERIQLDAFHIRNKEAEFRDKHGRDPDVQELSDITKLPVKRLAKVRTQFFKVPTSAAMPDESVSKFQSDYLDESMGYVFDSCDYVDRKILEHRFNYGGGELLPNHVIGTMLGIRPDVLSKRYKKLQDKINKTYEVISKTYE